MTIAFVMSQVAALIAWLFFAFSYHAKRENRILLLQIISGLFYCVSYVCAGATTGFLISLFESITAFFYYKTDKDKYIYLITIPLYILIGLVSINEDGFLVIVPILGSLIDGYGMIRNNKVMVISGIVSNILWIVYDLYFLEYVTALGDALLVISNLSIVLHGVYLYFKRHDVRISIPKRIKNKDIESIQELDEEVYDNVYRWNTDKLKELYNVENDSYVLIKHKGKLVGYVNFLNVTEDVYNKVLESDKIFDNFINSDIKKYKKNELLYINMNSIVLKREYNNKALVERIEKTITKYINKKIKKRYKIKVVFIYAVNEFEQEIVKDLGYDMLKKISEECLLYSKAL